MYGGHRLGNNLFANTLVCVRCATGERVWHYQIVHHDLWDYDLPAAPILADITVAGDAIKAVVQLTKQAFAFVFDRADRQAGVADRRAAGADLRHAGRTHVAHAAVPDQASAVRSAGRHDRQPDRLHAGVARRSHRARRSSIGIGPLFTPPSIRGDGPDGTKGHVQLPGSVGGADWQGGAFDPETGILYVQSITGPFTADLLKGDPGDTNLNYVPGMRAWTARAAGAAAVQAAVRPHHRDRHEPGRSGVDGAERRRPSRPSVAETAEPSAARTPGPQLAARDEDAAVCRRGRSDHVEARIAAASRDAASIAPGAGGRKFRAFDKATGAVLWETELPAGTTGAPMTYMFEGKQYIVVAIGSSEERARSTSRSACRERMQRPSQGHSPVVRRRSRLFFRGCLTSPSRASARASHERSAPALRRARERVGESEGRKPSDKTSDAPTGVSRRPEWVPALAGRRRHGWSVQPPCRLPSLSLRF